MLSLLTDEQILTQLPEGGITLTTHRVCYEYKDLLRSYNQNIMLEQLTSCGNYYVSKRPILIFACIFIFWSLIMLAVNEDVGLAFFAPLAVGLYFGYLYFTSKRSVILISSSNAKITIPVLKMKKEEVSDFVSKVEQARNKRVESLGGKS